MSKAKQVKNIDAMLSDDSSEEEVQPKKGVKAVQPQKTQKGKPVAKKDSDDESSSSDIELLKSKTKRPEESKKEVTKKPAKKPTPPSDSDESSEEEVVTKKPVAKAKAPVKKVESSDSNESSEEEVVTKKPVAKAKAPVKKAESSDSDESSEEEVVTKKPVAKAKAPVKKAADSDEEEDESEEEVKVVKPAQNKPQQQSTNSGCTELFCKNLSWNTDENVLGNFFSKYGEVTNVKVLYDKNTGKARGLGFVAFATRDEAQAALDDADNLNVDSRLLQVTFSDQKPQNPSQGGNRSFGGNQGGNQGGNRSFGGNYSGDKHTIFVGNLGFKTNENSIRKFFQDCGNVIDVRVAKNEEGRSKGFCHVDFDNSDSIEKAKAKAGQELDGRELRVDASTPRQGGGNRGGSGGRGGRGGFRGGRGGYGNPMDRAKKNGAMITPASNAVVTFDDDDD